MTLHPKPVQLRLSDENAERVRRSEFVAIDTLQNMPAAALVVVGTVTLADGVVTTVNHKLGKAPRLVVWSPPRGASTVGMIIELDNPSRSQFLLLKATGYGATVTTDVGVL